MSLLRSVPSLVLLPLRLLLFKGLCGLFPILLDKDLRVVAPVLVSKIRYPLHSSSFLPLTLTDSLLTGTIH